MTKEQAISMVSNAEGYLWSFIPPKHFISEHPELQAAIRDLQSAHTQLGREIRIERGLFFRMKSEA
jgi:hypothetical protein